MLTITAAGAGAMMAALTALSDEKRRALVDDFAAAVAEYTTDEGLVYPSASNLIIARA
jgi:hypothetical protein